MTREKNPQQAIEEDFRVDVDAVFRKKGKGIYPFIPGFVIRYIKKIVHQDEINEALPRFRNIFGLEFIEKALLEEFNISIEVVNPENIPGEGRFVVAPNHPLGGLDGMALMHVIGKKRPDIRFISNDILMELKNINQLFVAVNKHGRNTRDAIAEIDKVYASDQLVLIFPAGLVSRRQKKGVIKDLEWKKSFISKAVQHKRDVIPVYIEGRNSDFFYNLAIWRKRLRIKSNIEMLFLADELFKQRNGTIRIHFGKPLSYKLFTSEKSAYEWAQQVKEHVYCIPQGGSAFDTP